MKKALDQRSFTAEQWAADEVFLGDYEPLQVQHFYRAMDFLHEHGEAVQKEVFWYRANLLNLTVDLIFFDTPTPISRLMSRDPLS